MHPTLNTGLRVGCILGKCVGGRSPGDGLDVQAAPGSSKVGLIHLPARRLRCAGSRSLPSCSPVLAHASSRAAAIVEPRFRSSSTSLGLGRPWNCLRVFGSSGLRPRRRRVDLGARPRAAHVDAHRLSKPATSLPTRPRRPRRLPHGIGVVTAVRFRGCRVSSAASKVPPRGSRGRRPRRRSRRRATFGGIVAVEHLREIESAAGSLNGPQGGRENPRAIRFLAGVARQRLTEGRSAPRSPARSSPSNAPWRYPSKPPAKRSSPGTGRRRSRVHRGHQSDARDAQRRPRLFDHDARSPANSMQASRPCRRGRHDGLQRSKVRRREHELARIVVRRVVHRAKENRAQV